MSTVIKEHDDDDDNDDGASAGVDARGYRSIAL